MITFGEFSRLFFKRAEPPPAPLLRSCVTYARLATRNMSFFFIEMQTKSHYYDEKKILASSCLSRVRQPSWPPIDDLFTRACSNDRPLLDRHSRSVSLTIRTAVAPTTTVTSPTRIITMSNADRPKCLEILPERVNGRRGVCVGGGGARVRTLVHKSGTLLRRIVCGGAGGHAFPQTIV